MIGIIAAMDLELTLLIDKLEAVKDEKKCGIDFFIGQAGGKDVVLAVSGVGKVNASIATTLMISDYGCNFIINTGIAGGVHGVNTSDVIIGNKVMYYDVDVTNFGYEVGQIPKMPKYFAPNINVIVFMKTVLRNLGIPCKEATIYSGDCFVSSFDHLRRVDTNVTSVVEMEGAAVAHVCTKASIDFLVLRYVSDLVGDPNQIANYNEFEAEMARRSSEICLEILNNMN